MCANQTTPIMPHQVTCHVCGKRELILLQGYEQLSRVSSDCKPWTKGGSLGFCPICCCIQKVIDDHWRGEAKQIYEQYSIYHQSNGVEQAVYTKTGKPLLRSQRLIECLRSAIRTLPFGRMLDVGCGNGATLRTFAPALPGWTFVGTEVCDKYRESVERIERVERLHTGTIAEIQGTFELITLIHVLEHIEQPIHFLRTIANKLAEGGYLLIQVPDHKHNPFDLLIADHASHFTISTLARVARQSGYEIVRLENNWIPKEISLVARKSTNTNKQISNLNQLKDVLNPAETSEVDEALAFTRRTINWLVELIETAERCSLKGRFGIFGTSIAAMSILPKLENRVDFFVDEDPNRIGRTIMKRPVYHPSELPNDVHVFICLPEVIATSIIKRLQRPDGPMYYMPPSDWTSHK